MTTKTPPGTLAEFIETYHEAITSRVIETYQPQYVPGEHQEPLPELLRQPLGAQEHTVRAAAQSLRTNRGTTIVGEMGTGKTYIAAAAAHMAGFRRVLVVCPPHLVEKWKREIEMTIPGTRAFIVRTMTQLNRIRDAGPESTFFTIISREHAKLTYFWKPAYNLAPMRTRRGKYLRDPETQEVSQMICCPDCRQQAMERHREDVRIFEPQDLENRKRKCSECGGALWTADNQERRSYALSEYIRKRMPDFFDLLICDEAHEYKGRNTAQGISAGNLAMTCKQSLMLTGTLMGGYASTIFYLLYRFSPEIREQYGYKDLSRWITDYGFREKRKRNPKEDEDPEAQDGRASKSRKSSPKVKEMPGIVPSALMHIIGNTIFLKLSDVAAGLPAYDERVITVPLDNTIDPDFGISQRDGYEKVMEQMRVAISKVLQEKSNRMLGQYLQSLTAYPDACVNGETVYDPQDGEPIVSVPPLREDRLYPKEQAMLDTVQQEVQAGRRTIVYVENTATRDITPRIQETLERSGIRTAILRSGNPSTERREEWVNRQVANGIQVLICNPKLVQTGLDLIAFPTIIWYQQDYSTYTMRQASRRSWRIGQHQPVQVIFMVYENTIQSDALRLIAGKMQSSLAIEGELPEEGLAAYSATSDNMVLMLAKQIIEEGVRDTRSIEQIFEETHRVEAQDEELLADGDWSAPPPGAAGQAARQQVSQELLNLERILADGPRPRPAKTSPQQGMTLFDWALGNA